MKKLLFAVILFASPVMAVDYYIEVTNAVIGPNQTSLRLTYEIRSYTADREVYTVILRSDMSENFIPLGTLSDDGVTPLTQQQRIIALRTNVLAQFDRMIKFLYARDSDFSLLPANLIGYEYPPAP